MPTLKKDYTGLTINNRTVLRFAEFTKNNDPLWEVQCRCGAVFNCLTQDLKRTTCRECRGLTRRGRAFGSLYNVFVQKVKKQGKENTITYDQFLGLTQITSCHYCADKIDWAIWQTKSSGMKTNAYHLDRIDNAKGYHITNVVVACGRCNLSRGNRFTYSEWRSIGTLIHKERLRSEVGYEAVKEEHTVS